MALTKQARWRAIGQPNVWQALLGQSLTFVAMVLPIYFRVLSALTVLVVVTTGALILSLLCSLGFTTIFPRSQEPARLASVLETSRTSLVAGVVVTIALGAVLRGKGHEVGSYLVAIGLLGLTQGTYLMTVAVAVRFADYRALAQGRLVYGLILVPATAVACLGSTQPFALVAASVVAFAAGAAWVGRTQKDSLGTLDVSWRRFSTGHVRSATAVTVSNLLIYGASQGSALATAALGPLQGAWAVVLRLTGGVGSVAQQVLAPAIDITLAQAWRSGDVTSARRAMIRGAVGGAALAALSLVISLGALAWMDGGGAPACSSVLLFSSVIFILGAIGPAGLINSLSLTHADLTRLVWATCKCACVGASLALLRGEALLMSMGVVELLFGAIYMALLRRRVARAGVAPATHHTEESGYGPIP